MPSGSRAPRWAASPSPATTGRPICCASADDVPDDPDTTPEGFDGRAPQLPGRGARLARVPRRGRPGRLPGPRHGAGQDPDDAGPSSATSTAITRRWSSHRRPSSATGRPRRLDSPPTSTCGSTTVPTGQRRATSRPWLSKADVVITTYGTAVRDIEALSEITWAKVVLDEAQAIKNPASETAQQLRRLEAGGRIALTGTPIENGLGDLWAIMDFANPGLVGPRPSFIAQLSKRATARGAAPNEPCGPSTASSCSVAPRPSRRSRPSCPTASTSSTTAR